MLFVVILFPILNSTIACALFFIILFCAWLSCKRYSLKKITSSYLSYAEGNTSYFNNAHSNGFRTHFLSPCMPFSFYVPLRFTARFLTSMRTFVLQFIYTCALYKCGLFCCLRIHRLIYHYFFLSLLFVCKKFSISIEKTLFHTFVEEFHPISLRVT